MKRVAAAFLCGFLFAIGLALSGMTMPSKVIGFLNLFGDWDPSLLFVLGGATGSYLLFNRLILGRGKPLFDDAFKLPLKKSCDNKLVIGSVLFGAGWGLAGVCPGPALASLAAGSEYILYFSGAMIIGVFVANKLNSKFP